MKLVYKLLCLLITLAFSTEGEAASSMKRQGYECTIKGMYYLTDDGVIAEYADHPKVKDRVKFLLDRTTGKTVGAIKNHNVTAYGSFEPQVVDRGNSDQYFKAVTIYGSNNPSIQVVRVEEFNDNDLKPFIESHGGGITTGTCLNI